MDSVTLKQNLARLLEVITDATQTVERLVSYSDDEHVTPELRLAIYSIEAACSHLCSIAARPSDVLVNKFMNFLEPACIQVALSNKIPDLLVDKPSGMHISELEKQTGIPQDKLGRILRLLATKHVFQEVSSNTFANNYLSNNLVTSNPLSNFGLHMTDECFKAASSLSDTLNTPELAVSGLPQDTAFSKYFGIDGTLFDYYSGTSADQMKRAERFGPGMIGWGAAIEANAVVDEFPWGDLKDGSIICDVGGGIGNISIQLAKRYTKLNLVLQDLPEQLEAAKLCVWPEKCPEAIREGRISFIPLDFFQEPPMLKCDVYYAKNILHNWSDDDCIKILSGIRRAMGANSKLLIHEFIVQPAYRLPIDESNFNQAPEPLLPNYGEGRIRQYAMDINMMVLLNSRERSLEDFVTLGQAVGLEFVKLWQVAELGLVEFKLPMIGTILSK